MIALNERYQGMIMLAIAALMLLGAILITNGAIARWRAISAIQRYHMGLLSGKDQASATSAKEAAALMPDDAATALAHIDPASDSAMAKLEQLARVVPLQQRGLVNTTLAFSLVLNGKSPGDGADGADAILLKRLSALGKGEMAPFPEFKQGDTPSLAIYSRTAQAQAQAAWQTGKASELRAPLAALAMLHPHHPEAPAIRAVLAAVNPDCDKFRALDALSLLGDKRIAWARRLAVLVPSRATLFLTLIPSDQRTDDENQQINIGGAQGEPLKTLVERTLASPGEAAVVTAFIRCIREGELDLADKLVEKAPEGTKQDLQLALAYQRGDFLTVGKLDPKRTDLKPQITVPIGRPGSMSFHLSSLAGLIPTVGGLDIRIDSQRVAPDRIKRFGSLVMVEFKGTGDFMLEVRIGETVVFAGKVRA